MRVDDMLQRGWTIATLARALEVNYATVYRWRQRGESRVHQLALDALLGEDPNDFAAQGASFVYIVRADGMVKIGRASDPYARLLQLQVGSPIPLKLLWVSDDFTEEELHQRFSQYRKHGEWFAYSDEIRDFIAS